MCRGCFRTLRGYRRPLLSFRVTFSQRSLLAAQFIRSAAFASAVLMLTPWVGWDPAARGTLGGPRGGRALRARTGGRTRASRALGRARAARAHGAFGAARAEGPKGQGGHWDFSEGWPNGRVSKVEARLNLFLLYCYASGESLPLGFNALFVLLWRESLPLGIIWGRQGFESSRLT